MIKINVLNITTEPIGKNLCYAVRCYSLKSQLNTFFRGLLLYLNNLMGDQLLQPGSTGRPGGYLGQLGLVAPLFTTFQPLSELKLHQTYSAC